MKNPFHIKATINMKHDGKHFTISLFSNTAHFQSKKIMQKSTTLSTFMMETKQTWGIKEVATAQSINPLHDNYVPEKNKSKVKIK